MRVRGQRRGALVALGGLVEAALRGEVVALGGLLVGVVEVEQAVELLQRLGVVVDAQVHGGAPRHAGRRDDEDRRGLAPAGVAALRLGGVQRGHEPAGERSRRAVVGLRHGRPHGGRGHHVGLHGGVVELLVTGVGDAARARVHGHAARHVDHGDLADVGGLVLGERVAQRVGGRLAALEAVEEARAVGRLGHRLRGDGADARPRPGDHGPDGEPVRLHRDPHRPGVWVAGDHGVGATAEHGG